MVRKILYLLSLVWAVQVNGSQLPVVKLTAGDLSASYSKGTFQLEDGEVYSVEIRHRGASALNYAKKAFAVKFVDANGDKLNVSLLGMRSDNSWILDAMAVDKARMRNRVSTDLWNDFARDPYFKTAEPKMLNGTRGEFVEVYLNGEYWGLYCLTEKIDRKQLKLKKIKSDVVKGVLYKSTGWSSLFSEDEAFYNYDNMSPTWHALESSYPELDDEGVVDWKPIADAIRWMSFSDETEVNAHLADKFDLDVWEDYFLFVEFLMAEDNIGKNQYLYYYDITAEDARMGVAPWDMDHSWGRDYKGDTLCAEVETETWFNRVSYLMQYVYTRLDKTYKQRYDEMRESYFTPEKLKQRFADYFALFRESGAAEREKARWSGTDGITLDFDAEEQYIYDWIDRRFAFMDQKYSTEGIRNTPVSPVQTEKAYKRIINNRIVIVKGKKMYNLMGQEIQIEH